MIRVSQVSMDSGSGTKGLTFQERFDPALISALYKNFKDPIQAILEIIDNAVDDMIPGKRMIIAVDIKRDRISITNKGGTGMGPRELENLFIWGLSEKRGKLGRYGQGGKAAMGYLGRSWSIRSTKAGEEVEYIIEELDWDDRTGGLKTYKPQVEKTMFVEDGVVQIDIWNLKRKVNKKELKRLLGDIYRPLIELGEVEILLQGKIPPLDIQIDMEERFTFTIDNDKHISGWLGFQKEGSSMRGGIRCYAFGRLITEREFFGQKEPSFKASINRLIGEIYIDFEIPLLMNKTDFDRGSNEWQEIKNEMQKRMDPYISVLLDEKESDLPTEKEQKEVEYAGDVWKEFLKYREHLQADGRLPGIPQDFGQKPPGSNIGQTEVIVDREPQNGDLKRGPYDPATPPPLNAIGKRRRTGAYPKPLLRPLPEFERYRLEEEEGEKVILINTSFPLYKLRRHTVRLYIWETLALEYAKAEDADTQTVNEYIDELNELLVGFAKFMRKKNIKITS